METYKTNTGSIVGRPNGGISPLRSGNDVADTIKVHSSNATKTALDLADAADEAAKTMIADAQKMLDAVTRGADDMRAQLRDKLTEFSTAMQKYSDIIAEKNVAFLAAGEEAMKVMEGHTKMVRSATSTSADEKHAALPKTRIPV